MKRRAAALAAAFALMLAPPAGAEPLTLEAVSAAAAKHFPETLERLARLAAAEGDALAARGAFDLLFSAETSNTLSGFYDGQLAGARLSQNIAPFGGRVVAGYRASRGTFPIYRDESFTNRGGEAKLAVYFSLLRDRAIDDRRFRVLGADLEVERAALELLLTRIGVQHRAQEAYWRWVAAGRQLAVYEELLRFAEDREKGLEAEVRAGARAAIFLTENRQNITRRQIAAAEARRAFENAANELSFFYRDATGAPLRPSRADLPARAAAPAIDVAGLDRVAAEALARRPDLTILAVELERAEAAVRLAENARQPRLDVAYETSNDFGAIGRGGASRDGAENVLGLRFEAPLQFREGRGRTQKAEAELEALKQRQRLVRDRIDVELRNIILDLGVAAQLAELARIEVEQSETMREAERRRFASGASDFFLVNLREEAAANAQIRLYQSEFEQAAALTRFNAATVNLSALGLSGS